MERQIGQVKFTEIDGKFRVEVSGDRLKEVLSKCCVEKPKGDGESDCCDTDGNRCISLSICCCSDAHGEKDRC